MLKIGNRDQFSYPVRVEAPDESGKMQAETFTARFKRYTREQFQAAMQQAGDGALDDLALAREVLIGWQGIVDGEGEPINFSDGNREWLLNVWPVLPAVVAAWIEAHTPRGRAKN